MRETTIKKYTAIQARYKELYDVSRLRHDDVIKKLMDEFFIAHEVTIWRILRTDLDKKSPASN